MVDDELGDHQATRQKARAPEHQKVPVHDGGTVDEEGVCSGGVRCRGQNPRQPGCGNDLATLDRSEPPAERGQHPRDDRCDQKGVTGPEEHQKGEADHQAEQGSRGRHDRRGEDLAGRGVPELEDGPLEALVDQTPPHTSEDIAHGSPDEQPDHGCVGPVVDAASDLEAEHRAGEDEEQPEPFDEDHVASGPSAARQLRFGCFSMLTTSVAPRNDWAYSNCRNRGAELEGGDR